MQEIERTLKLLEFEEIVKQIAKFAYTILGQERIFSYRPTDGTKNANYRHKLAIEMQILIQKTGNPPLGALPDIRESVDAAKKGKIMEITTICELKEVLAATRELKSFLRENTESENFALPLLSDLKEKLHPQTTLERRIQNSFYPDGTIKDEASEKLSNIRKNIKQVNENITHKLRRIIRDPAYHNMVQEPIITKRQERFVIPIKIEFQGQFRGIMHGYSASGATAYMEPMLLVEDNNYLTILHSKEKIEEGLIVKEISQEIGKAAEAILESCNTIAKIDASFAIAKWTEKVHAEFPMLEVPGRLRLENARHPLLGEKAVPISLEITDSHRILVITGPNTGGKTVTLKTLGLFTLLAMSGFPVPGSLSLPPIKEIVVDLGDEQSITQNLSTFSAHISYLVRSLPRIKKDTLVLLDEIGAGTDPEEGGALGIAILSHLADKKTWAVATTHLGAIKVFAANSENILSGSMEFDLETLSPTYKLKLGRPGQSLALTIAARLGVPEEIVKAAEQAKSSEWQELDQYLTALNSKEQELSIKLETVETHLAKLNIKELEILSQEEELKKQTETIKEKTLADAKEYLRDLKTKIEERLLTLEVTIQQGLEDQSSILAEKEAALIQEAILKEETTITKEQNILSSHKISLDHPLNGAYEILDERKCNILNVTPKKLYPGLRVWIVSLKCEGVVAEDISRKEVLVFVGRMQIRLPIHDLRLTSQQKDFSTTSLIPDFEIRSYLKKIEPPIELHLRRMTVEEAILELEKYLDDCVVTSKREVRIVHGKGEGILRKAVHLYLKSHPCVRLFRLGGVGEGGSGVTVVELR